jgi:hypothetical protein
MNAWATIVVEGTWLNERECEINNVEIDGVVYKQDQGLLVKRDVSFLGSIEMCVCWRQLFVTFRLQIASTKETCWVCHPWTTTPDYHETHECQIHSLSRSIGRQNHALSVSMS